MSESHEHLKRKVAALVAQVKQRDHEIRELKEELALVNSIAHYRLTLLQASGGKLLGKLRSVAKGTTEEVQP